MIQLCVIPRGESRRDVVSVEKYDGTPYILVRGEKMNTAGTWIVDPARYWTAGAKPLATALAAFERGFSILTGGGDPEKDRGDPIPFGAPVESAPATRKAGGR